MIENYLSNCIFITLLFSMILSWATLVFVQQKILQSFFDKIIFVNASLITSWLILRWMSFGHFPLSNLYESLIFLTLVLVIIQIFQNVPYLKLLLSPVITFIYSFASLSLPKEMQVGSALVPALQSNWLIMHVTIMIISYGTLLCGTLCSITYLIIKKFFSKTITNENLVFQLDDISSKILTLGFPCLTIGILSGAVWANEAWGSYWSWDPKETWALITWLVFAIYLHLRINKNWQGEKSAWIATLGFVIIWICYLGVNLLGKGLHSYGWFIVK